MKTKVINDEIVHGHSSTAASQIVEMTDDTGGSFKKFKFTYSNGNAFENFKMEVIDISSGQLHPVGSMTDLGFKPDKSSYNLLNQADTQTRVKQIMKKGYEYIKLLY